MTAFAGWPIVGLLLMVALPASGEPTAALPPAPPADAHIALKYPPVPLEGTEWAKTVKKREAAMRRMSKEEGVRRGRTGTSTRDKKMPRKKPEVSGPWSTR